MEIWRRSLSGVVEAYRAHREKNRFGEIERLKQELERDLTDEDRNQYRSWEVVRIRNAYLVRPQLGIGKTLGHNGITISDVERYEAAMDELYSLTPPQIDWRIRANIRGRIEDLQKHP